MQGVVHRPRQERARVGREFLGRQAVEEAGKRDGDAFQPDSGDGRRVTAEQSGELCALTARRVGDDAGAQRIDEEVELHQGRPLAPQRPVVVEVGDPLDDRHVQCRVQEADNGVAYLAGAPRRKQLDTLHPGG